MTKRDYFAMAYALRCSDPRALNLTIDIASDDYALRMLQWEATILQVARIMRQEYANFNQAIFLAAAGFSVKPDGSQWSVDWATNRVPNFRSI